MLYFGYTGSVVYFLTCTVHWCTSTYCSVRGASISCKIKHLSYLQKIFQCVINSGTTVDWSAEMLWKHTLCMYCRLESVYHTVQCTYSTYASYILAQLVHTQWYIWCIFSGGGSKLKRSRSRCYITKCIVNWNIF